MAKNKKSKNSNSCKNSMKNTLNGNRINPYQNEINEIILSEEKSMIDFLNSLDLTKEEFFKIVSWEISDQIEEKRKKAFWSLENLMSVKPS